MIARVPLPASLAEIFAESAREAAREDDEIASITERFNAWPVDRRLVFRSILLQLAQSLGTDDPRPADGGKAWPDPMTDDGLVRAKALGLDLAGHRASGSEADYEVIAWADHADRAILALVAEVERVRGREAGQ